MRLPWVRWCVCWALCLVALFYRGGAVAAARELHWRELSVQARLDADGRLHVSERQVMVFTGDWNGGERSFRLAGEHELTLESVARVDLAGGEIELRPGDLTLTDEYATPREEIERAVDDLVQTLVSKGLVIRRDSHGGE